MKPHPKEPSMSTKFSLPDPVNGWQPISLRPVRVLVTPANDGMYVGRCLEHNIAVQGASFMAIAEAMTHVLVTQCIIDQSSNVEMLSGLKPAPDAYWQAWETAQPQFVPSTEVKVSLFKGEKKKTRIKMDIALAQCEPIAA